MVLYKYCPKCYSLNIAMDQSTGGHKCRQCGYSGMMNQDSIDKINIMKKSKDGQRYAAATSDTRPTMRTGGAGRDCEIVRKKVDPYNDDIEEIDSPQANDIEDDDEETDLEKLESKQSNIMKRSSQPMPRPMHGLSSKDGRSLKERLKDKGGKDWDLV
ncbi:MAG: hypothetical protein WCX82_00090 [archaeon]